MSNRGVPPDRVIIAIDPHKASWTAAAVGTSLQPLATIRVPVSPRGYRDLRRFAARWPGAEWAIEGACGLGAPLATRLFADGIGTLPVPEPVHGRVWRRPILGGLVNKYETAA